MAEFEDQLNNILSNPGAMSQIMQLAQTLNGGNNEATENPDIPQGSHDISSPNGANHSPSVSATPSASMDPASLLSSLSGSMDPKLLGHLLPLIQDLGSQQNSNARKLLEALRPYLKEERQEKVERALQLARLFHLGKKFLAGWGAQ